MYRLTARDARVRAGEGKGKWEKEEVEESERAGVGRTGMAGGG